ncbi:hypothetical protein M3Y14_31010 (plasmid) [Bacillus thuringiensis]|uniref:hypothetical protein n=1 Tax=Bacillus thuringiensis TaxID=1428 RepID=UPI002223F972|nr:hypothetical protein [Bacillus thuringiensis]UYX55715.1 hypothetical protein M3Y14_31010 [Bacillus thuringiensis]
MNYGIYLELESRIAQAYYLYERRNIIKNGDFHHGLDHWHATPHARVEQIDNTAVLVIPNWGSNVSQNVCLEHNRGYVLRVTAKKKDMGKGNVTISDCAKNTETLTFTSCDYVSNEITRDHSLTYTSCDEYVSNDQSEYRPGQEINEGNCYHLNPDDQPPCCLPEKKGSPCYNPSEITHTEPAYHSSGFTHELTNYVTRTIDFFPDTDRVRIDIGETEGIFKVESVELICMEGE